ncbi:DUF4180 domain-containing protein [Cellulosilyticum sp. I15G10I2]|uniref:DUF4180 domain-containing protein n=1 Tax=Cellulosilyticum sp. I15G10I2 TaxID=1892843 RepID=UPI00085CC90C|nr:DUF4180 domain-containing protein [Cellulosilyticum sp. I15G10I2]
MIKYTFLGKNNAIVYIESEDILISDPQSALDLMMSVQYEKGCSKMILDKKAISEEFFRLSSGIAGEVLQKFINYHTKLAVIGDYSKYTSKPLSDFIYECNKGNDIFFVDHLDQAVEKLDLAH